MSWVPIKLEGPAVIGAVEQQFNANLPDGLFQSPIVVDMSDVSFIEIATMVYLCQFIHKRIKNGLRTKLVLPGSTDVLMTLHTWRFFEVVEELTRKPITDFVDGDAARFKNIKVEIGGKAFYKDISTDYFDKFYADKGIQNLVRKGFFSLVFIPFETGKEKRFALRSQRLQWTSDQLISAVLERNLLQDVEVGSLFANTIIYECLTNAARHPRSDSLIIGSFFDFKRRSKQDKKNYHFTIVLWDNGRSIVDTLRDAIKEGGDIRSTPSFLLAQKSGLTSSFIMNRKFASNSTSNFLNYDYVPTAETADEDLLVSSFFPGISRDPSRKHRLFENRDGTVEPREPGDDQLEEKYGPGLGLTFLLDAAVKRLGGEIAIRTKSLIVNIKAAPKGLLGHYRNMGIKDVDSIYKVKIAEHTGPDNEFVGNMITIRIPLKFTI